MIGDRAYIKQTQEILRKKAIMQEEQNQRKRDIKEAVRYNNKIMVSPSTKSREIKRRNVKPRRREKH